VRLPDGRGLAVRVKVNNRTVGYADSRVTVVSG